MQDKFEQDLTTFRELLVDLEQRGGHPFLEALFIEQIDIRERWLKTHSKSLH